MAKNHSMKKMVEQVIVWSIVAMVIAVAGLATGLYYLIY